MKRDFAGTWQGHDFPMYIHNFLGHYIVNEILNNPGPKVAVWCYIIFGRSVEFFENWRGQGVNISLITYISKEPVGRAVRLY